MEHVDYVVLVDDNNTVLGTAPKIETHNANTPLHRGFSAFLFNSRGELLLQQRSHLKKTWPLVWSNSVCGHPMLDESPIAAAKRRFVFELGIEQVMITMVLPEYRYRFEKDGVVENEFCPVMVGFSDDVITPNLKEVEQIKWTTWKQWLTDVTECPNAYSPWAVEETLLLEKSSEFHRVLKNR